MWMILPVFLMFLPMANSFEKLILEPTDPFVFVGDCIVFTCTLNDKTLNDTSAVYFSHNSVKYPQSELTFNKKYVTLKKCFNSSRQKGSYVCKYSGSEEFAGQWVQVEEKLVPIPKDSIKCIIFNWQTLNCTWSLGQKYISMENLSVNLCYSFPYVHKMCKKASLTGASLNRRDIDLTIPLDVTLMVNYKHKNIDLRQETNFHLNASKPIKPSAVKNVQLNVNDTCVYVEWKHRYVYKLSYHLVLESMESKNLNFSIKVPRFCYCQLNPFMEYKLKVYALPLKEDGLYSEPYVKSFISNKSIPQHPPLITDGCFERDYSDINSVTLFWKGLNRNEFGDKYVQYIIQNKNLNITAVQNRLKLKLSLNKLSCEDIRIWAKNSVGQSKSPSSIRICDKSKVPGYPQKIETILINSTTVLINWEKPRDNHTKIVRYTVYGCHRENCSSNFIWKYIYGNHTSKMLSMNTDVSTYTFAVSAENEEGSSGIFWSSCYFTIKKPINPVEFYVKAGKNTMIVEWEHYNCNNEKAYISNYVVSYCVCINSTNCQGEIQERIVPKTEKKYQINNLPRNNYLVWVKSSTSVGDSPVFTKEQIYIYGLNVFVIIIPIIAILLVLIAAICFVIKWSKRDIDKMEIEYPVKTENKYNSISGVMHVDSLSSCLNNETYDSSSVLITTKLCTESSPEMDQNQTYSFEKTMPTNNSKSENDFNNRDIDVQDLKNYASKIQLTEIALYTDYKETGFTDDYCDGKKQAFFSENNDDSKNDTYIRAVSSSTCMNPHKICNNSSGYITDNFFEVNGESDYISNSSDIENISFDTKLYNFNSTDTVDNAVV